MRLVTSIFGSSSKKEEGRKQRNKVVRKSSSRSANDGSASFASSSSTDDNATTPRTVLPPSASSSFDTKKKGVALTREELEAALRKVVSSEAELAEMLAESSSDALLVEATDERELRETFAVFDADGDGRISAEELREVLASLGDEPCSVEDCRRMIRGVDTDGDGFVCFKEFTRMMMH